MKITDEVFRAFLDCKRKAHLLLKGQQGEKSDYEELRTEMREALRKEAREKILNCIDESQSLSPTHTPIAILKQGKSVIQNPLIEFGQKVCHFDALERVEGKSKLGAFHYTPVLVSENEKLAREDKLLATFKGAALGDVQGRQPKNVKIVYGRGS